MTMTAKPGVRLPVSHTTVTKEGPAHIGPGQTGVPDRLVTLAFPLTGSQFPHL